MRDSDGATTTAEVYFDTFDPNSIVIEAEDYNYQSGQFIDSPTLTPEGVPNNQAYWGKVGTPEVDFHEAILNPSVTTNAYRPQDAVGIDLSKDFSRQKFTLAGGPANNVYDYALQQIRKGEWLNYTRTFPAGAYEARLRQSLAGLAQSATLLERMVNSTTNQNQAVPLGTFLGTASGGQYRTVPLTDGLGRSKVIVRLASQQTMRLHQQTDDPSGESFRENFLILIPAADPGTLRPIVAEVAPLPGEAVQSSNLTIRATIVNRDTVVKADSMRMDFNGSPVNPSVAQDGLTISLAFIPLTLPGFGSTNFVKLQFADSTEATQAHEWSFLFLGPAAPRLESATNAAGPYAPDNSAVVDVQAQTIRTEITGQTMFYRLSVTGAPNSVSPRIDSIQLESTSVVLKYRL